MDSLPYLPARTFLPLACMVGLVPVAIALWKILFQDPAEEEGRARKKRRTLY